MTSSYPGDAADRVATTPLPPLPIRLPFAFLCDTAPALDDARGYIASGRTADQHPMQLDPVVAKIDAAPARKDGSVQILVTRAEAWIIAKEASYRAEDALDRSRDAWDSAERMQLLSYANSHRATALRAGKIVGRFDAEEAS